MKGFSIYFNPVGRSNLKKIMKASQKRVCTFVHTTRQFTVSCAYALKYRPR